MGCLQPNATRSSIAQQVVRIQQPVGDLRVPFQAAADGGGDGLAGLAAHAGQLVDLDGDAAHAAHLVEARGDLHAQAEQLEHAPLHVLQVFQALQVLQAFEQAFLFLAGQAQDAQVGIRLLQQAFAVAGTGAGRAGMADRGGLGHGLRS